MSSQLPTIVAFQSLWARVFRVGMRIVFALWIVVGALGALMSIIKPLGILVSGLFAVAGAIGLYATRRPVQEWGILSAFGFKFPVDTSSTVGSATQTSSVHASAEADAPSRPNNSLERTR
jgi:hypothetical protein